MKLSTTSIVLCLIGLSTLVMLVGCKDPIPEPAAKFEPNMAFAHQLGEKDEEFEEFLAGILKQIDSALIVYFGSPDDPKSPTSQLPAEEADGLDEDIVEAMNDLFTADNLLKASGPADAEGRGLYRKHCATCHGVTGNGRGEAGVLISPYPRDYRMGKFKFKSTSRGSKPTKTDIALVIKHGINGTPMKAIPELTDSDVAALTDYVVYLSLRGELERSLLQEAAFEEFDIYAPAFEEEGPKALTDDYLDQLFLIEEDYMLTIAEKWLDAEDKIVEVPTRDEAMVPTTISGVTDAIAAGDQVVKDSVERGGKLFVSDTTGCAKCHGKEGLGNGVTDTYDDWLKDIAKLKETDRIPLIARGALPPKPILPRNFHEGVYRGGDSPEQLFLRIKNGIEGTPMPAAAAGITPENIWDLVNFIRSLSKANANSQSGDKSI